MDILDFEELVSEMLDVTEEQREEDEDYLPKEFYNRFGIGLEEGFDLAKALLRHTVPVESGLLKKRYYAFVSKKYPLMLMKTEATSS